MQRYIDADELLARMKRTPRYFDVKHDIESMPTADVVPKSEADNLIKVIDNTTQQFLELHDLYQNEKREVERLENILNSYALQYGTVTDQHKVIENIKAEVVREIFEEIYKSVISQIPMTFRPIFKDDMNYDDGFRDGKHDAFIETLRLVDKLKKKYPEGNDA